MSEKFIVNGLVYVDHEFKARTVGVSGGKIRLLPPYADVTGGELTDATGKLVVPGFIDIHSHGAVGVDVNGATAEDLEKISRFMATKGTTSWLASVLTDTQEQTEWCIGQMLEHDKLQQRGAELLGVHLEGPFLAREYKGAMPEHLLQDNNLPLIRRYQELARGRIRYITISPELPGAVDMIPELEKLGIKAAMGHSGASYDQAMAAVRAGVAAATHTGNAMRLLHQHEPAIFGAALESDIYCEIICDGLHLHPGTVRLILKTKGPRRVVAITDSIMAAGLPDGDYHLGVNQVVVKDGDAKLASDGTRAGSTLSQDRALRNLIAFTERPLRELLPLLSENPAKLLGIYDRKGSIAEGKDADLVILGEKCRVEQVFVRGRRVFSLEQ